MNGDKFAPRINNVKQEKIGKRFSEYSKWHRGLGSDYLAVDIDFVEYRTDRGIVAFIDVTGNLEDEGHILNSEKYVWQRTKVQRKILSKLSEISGVPAYFVLHTKDLSLFYVYQITHKIEKPLRMTNQEYAEFIKNL